ncbi:hypothetical protein SUGI_1069220 [Cryptomeria japonica]|nr:hypothetical protein SUGI_1069220 [Cryptomeria japonica]
MEFPFGHSHHQHHHREEEEEERRKHSHQHYPQRESNAPPYPYPPPGTQFPPPGTQFPPPPQPFAHVQHHEHQGTGQVIHHEAYPSYDRPDFGPPPPNPYPRPGYDTPGDSFPRSGYEPSGSSIPRPGYEPSGSSIPRPGRKHPDLPRGQVVRVSCKADPAFSLAIRNGSAVLVHANANDEFQQWIKDETFSVKVKDERSYPSFALVNKATGQALKHALGETQPVLLTEYRPDTFDESILWTMMEEGGESALEDSPLLIILHITSSDLLNASVTSSSI